MTIPQPRKPKTDQVKLLQELMKLYGQDVWNFAYSLTKKSELADDVTQDVFIKSYQKLDTIRDFSVAKYWLLRITRNTAYDYLRSFYIKRVIPFNTVESGEHPSAETEAFEKINEETAWKSVLKLPIKYREVLILYAHHNLTIPQIAEMLGLLESTVKTRLKRAKSKATKIYMEGELNE